MAANARLKGISLYSIALLGTGYMARKHCDVIRNVEGVRLHTLCARNVEVGKMFAAEYGFERTTGSIEDAVSDREIDVVYVCLPDNLHVSATLAALQSGKHVLCEKALARSDEEFGLLRTALSDAGTALQVGMNCRFRIQYEAMHQLAKSRSLGNLRFLRGTYVLNAVTAVRAGSKPWALDYPGDRLPFTHGGIVHCLDLMRWVAGPVRSVFARATGEELGDVWERDTFLVSLGFESGAIGELLGSGAAMRPNDFTLEGWFERGSLLDRHFYRRVDASGEVEEDDLGLVQETPDLELELRDLLRAAETGTQPLNSLSEAEANYNVLRAIEESARRGELINIDAEVV